MTTNSVFGRPVLISLLAASLIIGGCASSRDGSTPNIFSDISAAFEDDDPTLLPEQRALRRQQREYSEARLTSAAVGAAGGALAGAVIGAALGGGRGAATGAAVGLLAGGTAGYIGGTYLTRDHQSFTVSRDTLQNDIDAAKAETEKMRSNVQVAEVALAAQRTEINRLNASLRARQISEEAARQKLQTAAADVAAIRALAEESERRNVKLAESAARYRQAGLPTGQLDSEIARQKAEAAKLRNLERQLVEAINRTPANVRPVT
ncbi:hypothetical protein [Azospirillum halopraeferens]|uniref:hypothetical protein n=1 Tax=Azospirillum halopraeferens TaxID=34010 RepID=UPI0012ECB817|nr:hypothetical protein [Azospirillum halopraeferens]